MGKPQTVAVFWFQSVLTLGVDAGAVKSKAITKRPARSPRFRPVGNATDAPAFGSPNVIDMDKTNLCVICSLASTPSSELMICLSCLSLCDTANAILGFVDRRPDPFQSSASLPPPLADESPSFNLDKFVGSALAVHADPSHPPDTPSWTIIEKPLQRQLATRVLFGMGGLGQYVVVVCGPRAQLSNHPLSRPGPPLFATLSHD